MLWTRQIGRKSLADVIATFFGMGQIQPELTDESSTDPV